MEEAREYGLPRGTCFEARRLELVAVAGRLRASWYVLGDADFFCFFSFLFLRISSNAHGLLQVRVVPCLMYLATSSIATKIEIISWVLSTVFEQLERPAVRVYRIMLHRCRTTGLLAL